jgi:hypothetical protein
MGCALRLLAVVVAIIVVVYLFLADKAAVKRGQKSLLILPSMSSFARLSRANIHKFLESSSFFYI